MLYTPDSEAVLTSCGKCRCLLGILIWPGRGPSQRSVQKGPGALLGMGSALWRTAEDSLPLLSLKQVVGDTTGEPDRLTPVPLVTASPASTLGCPLEFEFQINNE